MKFHGTVSLRGAVNVYEAELVPQNCTFDKKILSADNS